MESKSIKRIFINNKKHKTENKKKKNASRLKHIFLDLLNCKFEKLLCLFATQFNRR